MKNLFRSDNKHFRKLHRALNTFEQLSVYIKIYVKNLKMQLLQLLSQFDFRFK